MTFADEIKEIIEENKIKNEELLSNQIDIIKKEYEKDITMIKNYIRNNAKDGYYFGSLSYPMSATDFYRISKVFHVEGIEMEHVGHFYNSVTFKYKVKGM